MLFSRLADLGDIALLAEAMALYKDLDAQRDRDSETARRKRDEEYAEQLRRHEIALTVECPFCGAVPGAGCRTAGPSGLSHSKGSTDHMDRYRKAKHLLDKKPDTEAAL